MGWKPGHEREIKDRARRLGLLVRRRIGLLVRVCADLHAVEGAVDEDHRHDEERRGEEPGQGRVNNALVAGRVRALHADRQLDGQQAEEGGELDDRGSSPPSWCP